MKCHRCLEAGVSVDMQHVYTEYTFSDPSEEDGAGYVSTCEYVCEQCGYDTECFDDHRDDNYQGEDM